MQAVLLWPLQVYGARLAAMRPLIVATAKKELGENIQVLFSLQSTCTRVLSDSEIYTLLPVFPCTAKPSVNLKSGLLDSSACVLSHCLIKAESSNLQLNSDS